ncbi:MAG: dUTP diphosphatase [Desulfarculaceae bacterium]|nr:dUTP diphosphatase [Desulfarculaceae bacterium]MCF8046424.1 dUTP diphosphatase [Desulfarculaceae bacterium]MCF8065491.1 dUTP diphosphatase [Desulfarculaceae bacterium]MCF8098244.1 dUTP diphosphatase [Desulfarculaceae bacterium]MCF8123773.1 dUTP diphosphatase [Desulfarculaceae bacterium]
MSRPQVLVKRLAHGQGLKLPAYESEQAAGLDLPAAVEENITIQPGGIVMVPTGLALAIPPGFEGQVRPRSGLAIKKGVTVVNAPGTIDADYRGEVMVGLINLGPSAVQIARGDRVAQLIIAPVTQAELVETTDLPASGRGQGGFGSTGA